MKLSIVVPVLDEAAELPALLPRLRALARHAEIVVVDGGSADGSAVRLRAAGFTVLQAPRGRALQMNAGAARARGEWLLFLHADTELPRRALAQLRRAMADRRVLWGRFDVRIAGPSRWFGLIAAAMNLRSRSTGIATGDQAMFVRRAVFEAVGGFPAQPLMEDVELSVRLRRLAWPACLPGPVITSGRRWLAHGVWRTVGLMWWLRLRYALGAPPEALWRLYYGRPRPALRKR
ncbi:MAG: glycosyl transferase [Gammaproteobacteria bacterium]|nr:MAG: glycosyl transferase [Gammaproteobacteria bacterium]